MTVDEPYVRRLAVVATNMTSPPGYPPDKFLTRVQVFYALFATVLSEWIKHHDEPPESGDPIWTRGLVLGYLEWSNRAVATARKKQPPSVSAFEVDRYLEVFGVWIMALEGETLWEMTGKMAEALWPQVENS